LNEISDINQLFDDVLIILPAPVNIKHLKTISNCLSLEMTWLRRGEEVRK